MFERESRVSFSFNENDSFRNELKMRLGQNTVAHLRKFHLRSLFHNYYSDWMSNQLDDGDDNRHIRSSFAFDQH